MQSKFVIPTDTEEKIKLDSAIVQSSWIAPVAFGGFEAAFEVKTVFVAEGSSIEIKGKSSKGKAPGTIKGKIFNNRFTGTIPIPEKVAADAEIWFEAKLPKHGIKMESDTIPARPPLGVSKLCWDKKEVFNNEIVTLTCQFESGVVEGDEVFFIIYEHNPDNCDLKVSTLPVYVEENRAEIQWEFVYRDDTSGIPTEEEKNKIDKSYVNPQYYFVVAVNGMRAGENRESGLLTFRDTIEITVKHGNCDPEEKPEYTITFADGSTTTEAADDKNTIAIDNAPPGPFTILYEHEQTSSSVTGQTGTPLEVLFPDTCVFIDAHMHIQSNNCCPLTLQWAIVAETVVIGAIMGRDSEKSRKSINDTAAGTPSKWVTGRFGKVGRLSTDLISRLYQLDLKDDDLKQELYWTLLSEKEIRKYTDAGKQDKMRKKAGKKAELSKLSDASSDEFKEQFDKATSYYYSGLSVERMAIAHLMDLSFGSYWGRSGLPIYLPTSDAMYYINDFASCTFRESREWRLRTVNYNESVITPACETFFRGGERYSKTHLFPSFTPGEKNIGCREDFYTHQYELSQRSENDTLSRDEMPMLQFTPSPSVRNAVEKKFVHFLNEAPGEDPSRFEDYQTQMGYSIASAIRYPLSLFPFYHFDPRRHLVSGETAVEMLAGKILSGHSFFTLEDSDEYQGRFDDGYRLRGAAKAELHPELNDTAKLTSKLKNSLRSYKDALGDLHLYNTSGEGMFWGVKMYPRLGYSPADFVNYPDLLQFYKECSAKKIPFTAHCGPGGMSIADYFLYERYDEHRYLDTTRNRGKYDLKEAAKRFDGVVNGATGKDSPSEWAKVLEQVPDLKICLAHFGSSDTWTKSSGFEDAEAELAKRGNQNGKKYDDYDKYRDWVRKIAELVQNKPNVYTDISYFVNDDPSWFFGVGHNREDVAKDLIYLLKKYSNLKDRVLMGTDWYMIEVAKEKGAGDYFRKMFLMLRDVSKEVGFDAWHQFSVVNPLRFMGLIDDTKGGAGPFKIDLKNLESLRGKMVKMLKDEDWSKRYNVGKDPAEVQETTDNMITSLKSMIFKDGCEIKDKNDLLIVKSI